jgi:hypothetical protein
MKNNLTDNQIEFLLNYFFKNEKYAGWKGIATTLIQYGECIVVGDECIWVGGIGNFIHTSTDKRAIGCLLYEFDLEYFLNSEWFKEIQNSYINNLSVKKREIEQQYEDIINL